MNYAIKLLTDRKKKLESLIFSYEAKISERRRRMRDIDVALTKLTESTDAVFPVHGI